MYAPSCSTGTSASSGDAVPPARQRARGIMHGTGLSGGHESAQQRPGMLVKL